MEEFMRKLAEWLVWLLVPVAMILAAMAAVLILAPGILLDAIRYILAGICLALCIWSLATLGRYLFHRP